MSEIKEYQHDMARVIVCMAGMNTPMVMDIPFGMAKDMRDAWVNWMSDCKDDFAIGKTPIDRWFSFEALSGTSLAMRFSMIGLIHVLPLMKEKTMENVGNL